ncbi:hypothetical protein D3C81_1421760 [compost metagenome]
MEQRQSAKELAALQLKGAGQRLRHGHFIAMGMPGYLGDASGAAGVKISGCVAGAETAPPEQSCSRLAGQCTVEVAHGHTAQPLGEYH